MWYNNFSLIYISVLPLVNFISAHQHPHPPHCKASPGSLEWPTRTEWTALNRSVSGRLLQPVPPGAVCHPDQPTYDPTTCSVVDTAWFDVHIHVNHPISNLWNNWNNDSCIPWLIPSPCSGEGYPVYVINATSKEDVKKGVDFARKHNVRLNVKGTGHDYLGRSTSPNSLSIWTHNMKGLKFHDRFKPESCHFHINTPAITMKAGVQFGEAQLAASLKNLTICSGGALTVGIGGYLTGAGHSALSASYGLAADNVLEIEVVTPGGQILTVNECQHQDLFWALRGGGGSTFGVITAVTVKAFPPTPFIVSTLSFGTPLLNSETYWNAMAYLASRYPDLSSKHLGGYGFMASNTTYNNSQISAFEGVFVMPALSASNTSASVDAAISPVIANISATYPNQWGFFLNTTTYPSFYDWFKDNNGPNNAGIDMAIGSRLLDEKALTSNLTALKLALQSSTAPGGTPSLYLVSGKGVRDAVPRGGSNAVLPAWRTSLVHYVTGVNWTPLNESDKARQQNLLTNTYVKALRDLAPDTGAYINEADANEPHFQKTFWGANYPRLLKIKREIDPDDVLWCTPCVGNERWHMVGNRLCRV
ncbi:hypothetical protein F5884DRAFT_672266 [Xylogone sp. PMI_703]|nr:hypothetical protein F5884DRAFT_672266 [Xylogone sp. PMI_703]